MKDHEQMVRSGFWQMINSVGYFIIQLAFIGVLSRFLSKAEWGLVAITNAINQFAVILSESGLGFALIYRRQISKGHLNATTFFNIATALFFALLFLFHFRLFCFFL